MTVPSVAACRALNTVPGMHRGSVCCPNPGCSKEVGSVGHEEAPSFYLPGWLLLVVSTWWETRVLGKIKQTIRTLRDYQVKPLLHFFHQCSSALVVRVLVPGLCCCVGYYFGMSGVGTGVPMSAPPGMHGKMQTPRPHPGTVESEYLGGRKNVHF